jgi:transposase
MKQVPRRQYSAEFKLGAVELADSVGVTEAARRLDVPDSSLCNWIKRKREGKLTVLPKAAGVKDEQAELSRLRKEVAQLKMDNEILRKATAYFAKEPR